MHVLIVDEEVPFPLNTGKRLRSYNLLLRLQKNHKITYVCYGTGDERLPDCPNVNLVVLPSPILKQRGMVFYLSLLKNIASALPYVVERHYSSLMCRTVENIANNDKIELIHCEWTPYTENIRHILPHVPSVLSAHNVEAQIWERYYQTEKNRIKKSYIRLQWEKMTTYEQEVSRIYNQVAVVSEPDRTIFEKTYSTPNVTVVANGVDEIYFAPLDNNVVPNSMVFTGSMDWRPNQDGIKYFIEDVFPIIKRALPDATATIVGRQPPKWLIELARKCAGITVTGTVEDVRPYIAESALYFVPLRIGGGSRLKILEALSMGKPVISTSIGAEGLVVRDNEHVLLRDGSDAFAMAAIEMLTNPEKFEHLGERGRELVEQRYTWDAIALDMENVWQRAIHAYRG